MKYSKGNKGLVFDIKEFAVFDGPGIRTTVFLKGCPLRCSWCHNPEGQSFKKELLVKTNGCRHCGDCIQACAYGGRESCQLCGKCTEVCKMHLRQVCGREYTADELAERLNEDRDFLKKNGGGVTFSGGEALAQPYFLKEVLLRIPDIHKAVETSGYCEIECFKEIMELLDLAIMDIKLADDTLHKKYTGLSNKKILEVLDYLKKGSKPYIIRVPLIPGVSDTDDNLYRISELLKGAKNLQKIELLPYHTTAGAKYAMVNRNYNPGFLEEQAINPNLTFFQKLGFSCSVL